MIIAGPGLVERIRQLLLPLLASYECDEPHWDEKGASYIPPISYERLMADLASEHHGDCTQEAQPCLRCHAEGWNHKATWLAERVAAFAAEVAQDRLDELNMVQGQLGLAQIALTKSEAREVRLREALRLAGERLHGLSANPICMAHVFDACPRYTCQETRAALAEPPG